MLPRLNLVRKLAVETGSRWSDHDAPTFGAALAYYNPLLVPLMLIAIAIGGAVFGREAAQTQLTNQIGALTGSAGGDAIKEMLAQTHSAKGGLQPASRASSFFCSVPPACLARSTKRSIGSGQFPLTSRTCGNSCGINSSPSRWSSRSASSCSFRLSSLRSFQDWEVFCRSGTGQISTTGEHHASVVGG